MHGVRAGAVVVVVDVVVVELEVVVVEVVAVGVVEVGALTTMVTGRSMTMGASVELEVVAGRGVVELEEVDVVGGVVVELVAA